MFVIKIEIGNHTTITRAIDMDKKNPTVSIFGMEYSSADIQVEGWHYSIELSKDYAKNNAWRS